MFSSYRPHVDKKEVLRRVKTVKTALNKQYTRWNKQGGSPTTSDIALNVRSWIDDMEHLSVFSDANSVGFQKAYNSLQEAWDNRDNKMKAIRHVGDALEALKAIPDEMVTSSVTTAERTKSIKSLYGEENARHMIDPNIFGEIQEIRRQISGYRAAKSLSRFPIKDVQRLQNSLREIAARYPSGTELNVLASTASESVNRAFKSDNSVISNRYIEQALNTVDSLLKASNKHYSPEAYSPNLTGESAASVKSLVDELHEMFYGYHFEMPDKFLPKAVSATKRVVKSLQGYDDPRSRRIADGILNALEVAAGNSKNTAVKSGGLNSWKYEPIAIPFNDALNLVDTLEKQLNK